MLQVKFFDVSMADLPRGVTLSEYLEAAVNVFLTSKPGIDVVRTHVSSVVMPPEDGGGNYRESPASIVVILALFYRG